MLLDLFLQANFFYAIVIVIFLIIVDQNFVPCLNKKEI